MLTTECKEFQIEIGCLNSEVCKRRKGTFSYDWSITSVGSLAKDKAGKVD